jgi:hypothetical protein
MANKMKDLTIVYENYIPDDLIADFAQLAQSTKIEKKEVQSGRWNNFEIAPINDIIIYINQHPVVAGIISNAIWAGVILLWVGISKLSKTILHTGRKYTDRQTKILLKISDNTRGIDIVFEGDVTEPQANDLIDILREFLNSEKVNNAFYDSDNIPEDSKKPEIRLIYNQENKTWEPENFGEKRRKMDELRKQAQRKFRS